LLLRSGNQEEEDWDNLESIAKDFLEKSPQKSYKGFFYYGIALYKLSDFESAVKSFTQALSLSDSDPQLHYNLALAYFKLELYNQAVDHWRKCIRLDPSGFPHAYSNLAFLFNLH